MSLSFPAESLTSSAAAVCTVLPASKLNKSQQTPLFICQEMNYKADGGEEQLLIIALYNECIHVQGILSSCSPHMEVQSPIWSKKTNKQTNSSAHAQWPCSSLSSSCRTLCVAADVQRAINTPQIWINHLCVRSNKQLALWLAEQSINRNREEVCC